MTEDTEVTGDLTLLRKFFKSKSLRDRKIIATLPEDCVKNVRRMCDTLDELDAFYDFAKKSGIPLESREDIQKVLKSGDPEYVMLRSYMTKSVKKVLTHVEPLPAVKVSTFKGKNGKRAKIVVCPNATPKGLSKIRDAFDK